MDIKLELDAAAATEDLEALEDQVKRAHAVAVNVVATHGAAEEAEALRRDVKVAQRATASRPIAVLRTTEDRVGVVRGRSSVASALASDRKAFVARMPSGKIGVYRRKGRPRLPIELVFSLERRDRLRSVLKAGARTGTVAAREWEAAFGDALRREMGIA